VLDFEHRVDDFKGKLVIAHDKDCLGVSFYSYESFLLPHSIRVCVFFPDFTYRWYDEHELIYIEEGAGLEYFNRKINPGI